MSNYVYVDNSNVFIEAKRVSAVQTGLAMDIYEAMDNRILDDSIRLDFGRLHAFTAGNDPAKIERAVLFGSRPPKNDTLWKIARDNGFETVVEDRNVANKEKKIDTGIVTEMMRDAYSGVSETSDIITLVSGDGDYVPAVERLVEDGYTVEVFFWDHASEELKDACSQFVSLNEHLDHLTL
jgi:uncharacterized LabA/DUF88 family protein